LLIEAAKPHYLNIVFGEADPPELGKGNANVADGEADGDIDALGDTPAVGVVAVAVGWGVGVGVGVGGGGMMFSQWWSGTVAPPISSTSF
jgi:hypothetical protein